MSQPDNVAQPEASGASSTPASEQERKDDEPGSAADDQESPDLTSRKLCSDGSCIGVIGSDGLCKVCGKRAETEEPQPRSSEEPMPTGGTGDAPDSGGTEEAPDLGSRRLCSDGACIGVIGPDERCKVCGKPYAGEPEL